MALIKKNTKIDVDFDKKTYTYIEFIKYLNNKYDIKNSAWVEKHINQIEEEINSSDFKIKDCTFEKFINDNSGEWEKEEIKNTAEILSKKSEAIKHVSDYFNIDDYLIIYNRDQLLIFYVPIYGVDDDYNLIYIITDKTYEIYNIKKIEDGIN